MSDFNRDRGSRRGGFGRREFGRSGFGGGDNRRAQMHKAVCANCGNNCEVPFRPSGDKPVYCSDCFEKMQGSSPRRPQRRNFGGRDGRDSNRGPSVSYTEEFKSINTKLDNILKMLTPSAPTQVAKKEVDVKTEKSEPKKAVKAKAKAKTSKKSSK